MPNFQLVSFETGSGARAGAVVEGRVFDLAQLTGAAADASIRGLLADWQRGHDRITTALTRGAASPSIALGDAKLLAPVLYPSAIYCAGSNYQDHADEMAAKANRAPDPDPHTLGLKPWHFIKATTAVTHPGATVTLPRAAKNVDWEAELAAVIGRAAKDVPASRALDHVAGYLCANDLSARDLGTREALPATNPFRNDWTAHKSFDGSCPLGPWIVPADQVGDPQKLDIKLWVNDALKQDSNTAKMIFTLAEQIEQLSSRITLWPGDIVLTGTPAGVGAGRGEFLRPGDDSQDLNRENRNSRQHVRPGRVMTQSVLTLNYLSHGTLESYDIDKSRKFYEEFLGLEVVQTSPRSLMIRLGGTNTIATVHNPKKSLMPVLNHNGLDVATREEVDRAHAICVAQQDQWGIKAVTRPAEQHGTYSFYLRDLDDNWWEILTNPEGGYAWMFAKGSDIDNWGAGEKPGFNPNDFKTRRFNK